MDRNSLSNMLIALGEYYRGFALVKKAEPWHLILQENVAYLADDKRREAAFVLLQETVGLQPHEILCANEKALLGVGSFGIVPKNTVEKLRRCATIALDEFGGDLKPILKWPTDQAKKAFMRFPGIGEPSAEKILLFGHAFPILALESNGLRVLLRLGFGRSAKNYRATYKSVQQQAMAALGAQPSYAELIKAHQLLRHHGKTLCKTTRPLCGRCPLTDVCPSTSIV
jgi:endonuclease III